MDPGRFPIGQAEEKPLSMLCSLLNRSGSAGWDMLQVARGGVAMKRYSDWLRGLKDHRLPNLKILGEGDAPATHGEAEDKDECREKYMHVLYLPKLGIEYQAGPGVSVMRKEAVRPTDLLVVCWANLMMVIGHRPVAVLLCPGAPAASHWIGVIESRNEVVASGRQATGWEKGPAVRFEYAIMNITSRP